MTMFNHMHGRGGCGTRHGGPGGGGRWQRGPFTVEWSMDGGERPGGRGRRMFDGGELRLVLLKLIADEPRHGYDLIRRIEELTGGAYAPSPGVVYPTITLLDEMGMIAEQQSEGAKKRFAATDDGRTHLAENAELVAALMARLTALADHRDRADSEAARRAMRNLGEVVRGKLRRDEIPEDMRYAIVALIDEVAQKIERLK
jgi:DNA-binding PadR family transcriptional regulator